jgi:hypothetical protein
MHAIPIDTYHERRHGRSGSRVAAPWLHVYASDMREKERTVQTAVRMPESWVPRLDALAAKLSQPGITVSQAAVIRAALARGIAALEAENAPEKPAEAPTVASAPTKGARSARKPKPTK